MFEERGIETPAEAEPRSRARRANAARSVVDLTASLAMIVAAGVIVWTALRQPTAAATSREIPVPTMPISIDGAPSLGDAAARVVLVEFSDFQCPFCARFVKEVLPELKKKYVDSGVVRFVFKNLPLTAVHHRAEAAAEAAACAAEQGRFWPVHDALFAEQDKLEDVDIEQIATTAGLSIEALRACVATRGALVVTHDSQLAALLNVRATPAFLVGRLTSDGTVAIHRTIAGTRSVSDFANAIDGVLASH